MAGVARPRGVGHRRCGCLGNNVARLAGIFRAHVSDDLEVPWDIVQHLGNVPAQLTHNTAAGGTGAGAVGLWFVQHLMPWQVIRQRLAFWLGSLRDGTGWFIGRYASDVFSLAGLQFLQLQFQLLDLAGNPLRRTAKLHPAQLGNLEAQFFNLQRLHLHRELCRLQLALAGQREGAQGGNILR